MIGLAGAFSGGGGYNFGDQTNDMGDSSGDFGDMNYRGASVVGGGGVSTGVIFLVAAGALVGAYILWGRK